MVGTRCVAAGCNNTSLTHTLHKFPSKHPSVLRAWVKFVRSKRDWAGPTKTSVLCSAHFEAADYVGCSVVSLIVCNKQVNLALICTKIKNS